MAPPREALELYHAAAAWSPAERNAFLKDAFKGDLALNKELESLLRYESTAAQSFHRRAADLGNVWAQT